MKNINKHSFIFKQIIALFLLLIAVGCNDDILDDHYNQSDVRLDNNLLEVLSQDPELSKFVEYLKATNNDKLLEFSKVYTVWAPTNDVLQDLPTETINDPALLNTFIRNHISEASYSSSEINEPKLVKMLNNKYLYFLKNGNDFSFGGVVVSNQDNLASNGILHKINGVLNVNPNIWEYLNKNESRFEGMMSYLNKFNDTVFDEKNSVKTGTNTLGQIVYDSVFSSSNTYFDVIGSLNSEEQRYTTIGITNDAYAGIFNKFKTYYNLPPVAPYKDSIAIFTEKTIYENFNFPAFIKTEVNDSTKIKTTTGNSVTIKDIANAEDITLSNGNILVLNSIDFDPRDVMYKPIRYEIENSDKRFIGSLSSMTITKKYDAFASGEFVNEVKLFEAPNFNKTNNYFEVYFTNVLSAKYKINIKFSPIRGAIKKTKLSFIFSYTSSSGSLSNISIPAIDVEPDEDGVVQIGGIYTLPYYVSDIKKYKESIFKAKLKVAIDVQDGELSLYSRQFGIDYVELVPAE